MAEDSEHTETEDEAPDAAEPAGESGENEPEARIAELEAENAQLRDRMLRTAAEAENARKRAEREAANAREYALEKFAGDLLGVADNLTRALEAAPEDAQQRSEALRNLLAGVEMTQRELMRTFERHNVHAIAPKGEAFDPNFHQAVAQIPAEVPSGKVAEVMQTGYRLGDRVLRAAMVAVSTGPGAEGGQGQGGQGAGGGEKAAPEAPDADGGEAGGGQPGAQTDVKI